MDIGGAKIAILSLVLRSVQYFYYKPLILHFLKNICKINIRSVNYNIKYVRIIENIIDKL